MKINTLYVAPSGLDAPASQCRIYACADGVRYNDATYRSWREVGLMGHDGRIICIEPEFADLKHDVPLMAGVYYLMGEKA